MLVVIILFGGENLLMALDLAERGHTNLIFYMSICCYK